MTRPEHAGAPHVVPAVIFPESDIKCPVNVRLLGNTAPWFSMLAPYCWPATYFNCIQRDILLWLLQGQRTCIRLVFTHLLWAYSVAIFSSFLLFGRCAELCPITETRHPTPATSTSNKPRIHGPPDPPNLRQLIIHARVGSTPTRLRPPKVRLLLLLSFVIFFLSFCFSRCRCSMSIQYPSSPADPSHPGSIRDIYTHDASEKSQSRIFCWEKAISPQNLISRNSQSPDTSPTGCILPSALPESPQLPLATSESKHNLMIPRPRASTTQIPTNSRTLRHRATTSTITRSTKKKID